LLHIRNLWAWGRIAEHHSSEAEAAAYFRSCRVGCSGEFVTNAESEAVWGADGEPPTPAPYTYVLEGGPVYTGC